MQGRSRFLVGVGMGISSLSLACAVSGLVGKSLYLLDHDDHGHDVRWTAVLAFSVLLCVLSVNLVQCVALLVQMLRMGVPTSAKDMTMLPVRPVFFARSAVMISGVTMLFLYPVIFLFEYLNHPQGLKEPTLLVSAIFFFVAWLSSGGTVAVASFIEPPSRTTPEEAETQVEPTVVQKGLRAHSVSSSPTVPTLEHFWPSAPGVTLLTSGFGGKRSSTQGITGKRRSKGPPMLQYEQTMRQQNDQRYQEYAQVLASVDLFANLGCQALRRIAEVFVEQQFSEGTTIFNEGDGFQIQQQDFYVLLEGEVRITFAGNEVARLCAGKERNLAMGHRHFGGLSCGTTVTVTSYGGCSCLRLIREVIEVMPELFCLLGMEAKAANYASEAHAVTVGIDALEPVALLGSGAFGMVHLYKDTRNMDLFAVKAMSKGRIARSEDLKTKVVNEKYILQLTESSFITRYYRSCQDAYMIYFLLEPCLGGELYAAYWENDLWGKEEHARFYSASVALALEYLHSKFIAYRDLKGENCLLDSKGHLKITDMGLAKIVVDKTYTICGTAAYLAPEMLTPGGYTVAIDWWQLGIFTWELLAGRTPFRTSSITESILLFETKQILADLEDPAYEWPEGIAEATDAAKKFLTAILVYEPEERAPMQEDGGAKLRAMDWFAALDWRALEYGTLPPPLVPLAVDVSAGVKLRNFRSTVRSVECEEYVDDGTDYFAQF